MPRLARRLARRLAGKKPEDKLVADSFAEKNKLSSNDVLHEIGKRTGSRLDAARFGSVCNQFRSLNIRYLPILPELFDWNQVCLARCKKKASWRMQSLYLINPPPDSNGRPWIANLIQSKAEYGNRGPIYEYELWHPLLPAADSHARLRFNKDNIFNRSMFDSAGLSIIDLGQHILYEDNENRCTEKTAWLKDENIVVVVPKYFDQKYACYFRESRFERINLLPAGSKWDDLCVFKRRPYLVDTTGRTVMINSDLTIEVVAKSVSLPQLSRKFLVVNREVEELILVCYHFLSQNDRDMFKLFKLNQTEKVWVEISQLGDRVIFLGNNINFMASASELRVTRSNVIVFWERQSLYTGYLHQYNLDDSSVNLLYTEFSSLFWPAPMWVNDRLSQLPYYRIWAP